jgi:hypothetical protein
MPSTTPGQYWWCCSNICQFQGCLRMGSPRLSWVGEQWHWELFSNRGSVHYHLDWLGHQVRLVPFQESTPYKGSPPHFSYSDSVLLIHSSPITSDVRIQVWSQLLSCLVIDWFHNKSWWAFKLVPFQGHSSLMHLCTPSSLRHLVL